MVQFDYHALKKVSTHLYAYYISIYYLNLMIIDRIRQVKSENSLEYPFQTNVYPLLSELIIPESLMILQVLLIIYNAILLL